MIFRSAGLISWKLILGGLKNILSQIRRKKNSGKLWACVIQPRERKHGTVPAFKGIINGVAVGAVLWLIIVITLYYYVRGL